MITKRLLALLCHFISWFGESRVGLPDKQSLHTTPQVMKNFASSFNDEEVTVIHLENWRQQQSTSKIQRVIRGSNSWLSRLWEFGLGFLGHAHIPYHDPILWMAEIAKTTTALDDVWFDRESRKLFQQDHAENWLLNNLFLWFKCGKYHLKKYSRCICWKHLTNLLFPEQSIREVGSLSN